MIRFIDLRGQIANEDDIVYFAFYDTVTDTFKPNTALGSWKELEGYEGIDLARYRGLTPSWVFSPACACVTEDGYRCKACDCAYHADHPQSKSGCSEDIKP